MKLLSVYDFVECGHKNDRLLARSFARAPLTQRDYVILSTAHTRTHTHTNIQAIEFL